MSPSDHKKQYSGWVPPQTIPEYAPETSPPILIADQNRRVHAFSSQWVGDGVDGASYQAVIYNQWTLEQGWTAPSDILLSPIKEARVTDAYLDKNGFMHVVFFGGDSTDANIYYSKAPALSADKSSSWSRPIIISVGAGNPEGAVFVEDKLGTMYVIFSGRQEGNGVYVVSSKDSGQSWSDSIQIFLANSDAPYVYELHAIKSVKGSIHVIWNVYSVDGQGRGIYYSRLAAGGDWAEPVFLAFTPNGLGSQTPALIEYQDSIFAIYNLPPKITMRRSMDDGVSWMDAVVMFPRHVGVNGSLSLVVDRNNTLHLFFGQRITGNPDIHGMWHSKFINNRWTEPEAIVQGPQFNDPTGEKSFDPNTARAVVTSNNVLLVTWKTDPGFKAKGIWYSYNSDGITTDVLPTNVVDGLLITPVDAPVVISTDPNAGLTTEPSNLLDNDLKVPSYGLALTTSNVFLISIFVSLVVVIFIIVFIQKYRSEN